MQGFLIWNFDGTKGCNQCFAQRRMLVAILFGNTYAFSELNAIDERERWQMALDAAASTANRGHGKKEEREEEESEQDKTWCSHETVERHKTRRHSDRMWRQWVARFMHCGTAYIVGAHRQPPQPTSVVHLSWVVIAQDQHWPIWDS